MPDFNPIFLFAFANDQSNSLQLGEEQNTCWNALAGLQQKKIIECQLLGFATLKQLYLEFNRSRDQIHIFHYGGHSDKGILKLHGSNAHAENLSTKIGQQKSLKLVFLNGCKNHEQVEALLQKGVPAVIATTALVEDHRAIELAQQFYQALAAGNTIGEAFQSAKAYMFDAFPALESTFRGTGLRQQGSDISSFSWGIYTRSKTALNWRINPNPSQKPSNSLKNAILNSTISVGGNFDMGDRQRFVIDNSHAPLKPKQKTVFESSENKEVEDRSFDAAATLNFINGLVLIDQQIIREINPKVKINLQQHIVNKLYTFSQSNPNNKIISTLLAVALGRLAREFLCNSQFAVADKAARAGLELDLNQEWIFSILALALLFQGKWNTAKEIYIAYKGRPYRSEESWDQVFLKDLHLLEKQNITHPDTEKLKTLFEPSF